MLDDASKQSLQPKRYEHRTSSRYRLASPPEVEIAQLENGAPIEGKLRDLSQGGCFVETDCVLPVETELAITLKKSGDCIRAQARVVRSSPNDGLALAFTAMDVEEFRLLNSWLSIYVATAWVAANRRRSPRLDMQVRVQVSGYNAGGTRFTENTHTVQISGYAGSVNLRTAVKRGQRLVVSNSQTGKMVECMVAYHEPKDKSWLVGLAFIVLNQPFWPVEFPHVDWSPQQPSAQ